MAAPQCQSIQFLGNASSSQGVVPIATGAGLDILDPDLSICLCLVGPQCRRVPCPGPRPFSSQSLGILDGTDSVLYESQQRVQPWWVNGQIHPARPPATPATGLRHLTGKELRWIQPAGYWHFPPFSRNGIVVTPPDGSSGYGFRNPRSCKGPRAPSPPQPALPELPRGARSSYLGYAALIEAS